MAVTHVHFVQAFPSVFKLGTENTKLLMILLFCTFVSVQAALVAHWSFEQDGLDVSQF